MLQAHIHHKLFTKHFSPFEKVSLPAKHLQCELNRQKNDREREKERASEKMK